jgi:hypothetical protein
LHLKCDFLVSNFAFTFNFLCRYIEAGAVLTPPPAGQSESQSPAPAAAAAVARALSELERVLGGGAPPAALHPVKDLKLQNMEAVEACHELARLVAAVPTLPPSVVGLYKLECIWPIALESACFQPLSL